MTQEFFTRKDEGNERDIAVGISDSVSFKWHGL